MGDIDTDGLSRSILAGLTKHLRGSKEDDYDDPDDYGNGKIPRHRLQREIDKRRAAEAALQELAGKVDQLEQGYRSQVEQMQTATADQVSTIGKRHAEDLALVDAGITDVLGRQAVRTAWEKLPKDARGKSAADWWRGSVQALEAHRADPESHPAAPEIPRTLAGYVPQVSEAAPETNGTPKGPPSALGPAQIPGLDSVPPDQGMDAYLAGLRSLEG